MDGMTQRERWQLQFDRCGQTQLVKQPRPLTGIEREEIARQAELDELKRMHEEIDSFSVEAE